MVVATLNGLTSTLRSLNLDDPSRIARHLAIILTEQVYQALNGTNKVQTSEPLPETPKGEHWDPNCTLLALASRLSPHPLRAWLDVAVGQGIVDDEEADAMEKRLRQRFAPFGSAPRVFEQVIASPFTPLDKLVPLAGGDGDGATKSARIPQVCIQCRKDHQRCEKRGDKPCKRCSDHGWSCAFFTSSKRGSKGGDSKANKRRRVELVPEPEPEVEADVEMEVEKEVEVTLEADAEADGGDEAEEEDVAAPVKTKVARPARKRKFSEPARQICQHCTDADRPCEAADGQLACARCSADSLDCSLVTASRASTPASRRSSSKSEGRRAPSRELDNLSKGFAPSRTKAIDDALAELGMRKTSANIAFLKEAGLLPPVETVEEEPESESSGDEAGTAMEIDQANVTKDTSIVSVSQPQSPRKPEEEDDEDGASVDGSASEFSFFGETAAGTPATVNEPQFANEQQTSGRRSSSSGDSKTGLQQVKGNEK